ncbi:MAG: hypothetical protein ACT452_16740 [Microthrixaceae bacterium]
MRATGRAVLVRGAVAVVAVALATACSSASSGVDPLRLDGSPRVPDAEGIASIARPDLIEVSGQQYKVSPDLIVFSTHDLSVTPLVRWEGSYVQVGLRGKTVVWLAGVAGIMTGEPPSADLSGQVASIDGDRLVLRGGTVLTLGGGVEAPGPGSLVIVRLDPIRGVVREVLPA